MKAFIVIPAYNEERRIGKTLEAYSDYFENIRMKEKIDYEILVSINNTKDKTEEIVKKFSNINQRISYLNLPKGGKGYAVIEGFKEGLKRENDLIGFVDADMATSPEEYFKLIKGIDKFDGIIANRYLPGSKVYPPITFRRIVSGRIFNLIVRFFLFIPYTDTQCGAKIFRRKVIEKLLPKLGMTKWAFDVEMLYMLKKMKKRIIDIPTIWVDKEYSTINFVRSAPIMFLAVLRLRIINSPLRRFVRIYDKFLGFMPK